jgi:NAD+--dinitrogen-reductase ADP-D-ribosyltransferase
MESTPDITIATRGHSTNLVGVPTGLLASVSFNEFPIPLHISGTREANSHLFALLEKTATAAEAAHIFQDYMRVLFALDGPAKEEGTRRYRSSYIRLLKDWGFDANTPAGAVLKGWVESRFGLFPTYHREPISRFNSRAWITYVEEKMSSRFHNNSINMQLDLLYEFCQWTLVNFLAVGRKHIPMYRGTNDLREYQLQQRIGKREAIVRLNSLVSFSTSREIAEEFGDTIIEASIPTVKILLLNPLLLNNPLPSEAECLVIGGDYRVRTSYW